MLQQSVNSDVTVRMLPGAADPYQSHGSVRMMVPQQLQQFAAPMDGMEGGAKKPAYPPVARAQQHQGYFSVTQVECYNNGGDNPKNFFKQ